MTAIYTAKETKIRAEIARRGLRLEPSGPKGWHVSGHGVDLLVADLSNIALEELDPRTVRNHQPELQRA